MTEDLEQEYIVWMYGIAFDRPPFQRPCYCKLFGYLYETPFYSDILMDENRVDDGIQLRYRFGRRCGWSDAEVANALDCRSVSVLEVMLAMAIRCEEHIMTDPEQGDRTSLWFGDMLDSMGVSGMDDENYDEARVDRAVSRMLERRYKPNGSGGLFTAPGCPYDLREMELWYQMNWYLRANGYV